MSEIYVWNIYVWKIYVQTYLCLKFIESLEWRIQSNIGNGVQNGFQNKHAGLKNINYGENKQRRLSIKVSSNNGTPILTVELCTSFCIHYVSFIIQIRHIYSLFNACHEI